MCYSYIIITLQETREDTYFKHGDVIYILCGACSQCQSGGFSQMLSLKRCLNKASDTKKVSGIMMTANPSTTGSKFTHCGQQRFCNWNGNVRRNG